MSCTANGYQTDLIILEVGSKGFLNLASFKKLTKAVKFMRTEKQQLLHVGEVTRQGILGWHRIWTLHNKTN